MEMRASTERRWNPFVFMFFSIFNVHSLPLLFEIRQFLHQLYNVCGRCGIIKL